jgi:hypothetical protein
MWQRQNSTAGDFDVWPFILAVEYQTALRNPRLLGRRA